MVEIPRDLMGLWGEEITRSYQATSLVSLKDWLDLKLMGQRFSDNKLAYSNGWRKDSGGQSIATNLTLGICAIRKGEHSTHCPEQCSQEK